MGNANFWGYCSEQCVEELEEIDGALNDLETGVRAGGPGGDAFKSCECEQYQDCPVVNRWVALLLLFLLLFLSLDLGLLLLLLLLQLLLLLLLLSL